MTMIAWLVESAVLLALLSAAAGIGLYVLRVRAAAARLRVWTVVLLAGLVLPFVPAQWVLPITIADTSPVFTRVLTTSPATELGSAAIGIRDAATNVTSLVILLYLAGTAVLLLRIAQGATWARRLRREARPVAGRPFLESDRVTVPVTVGLVRPVILVPSTWQAWPAETLDAVLHHEGDHAARRDGVWLTLARVHCALHWLNPLSWWLARHLATLSERASDEAALAKGVAPTDYAGILLTFAAEVATHGRRVAWVVPMARHASSSSSSDTERRLLRVLSWKGRTPMTRARVAVLVFILVTGSVAAYTATWSYATNDMPIPQKIVVTLPPKAPPVAPDAVDGTVPSKAPAPVKDEDQKVQEPQPAAATVGGGPVLLRRVHPKYTPEAMRAKIQGTVRIEAVVNTRGEVTNAKIVESLDSELGLDAAALDAVSQWRYQPTTLNGRPVPVVVIIALEFRLH